VIWEKEHHAEAAEARGDLGEWSVAGVSVSVACELRTPNLKLQTPRPVNGERRTVNGERRTVNGERRTVNGER
jgi:hypothetical protein